MTFDTMLTQVLDLLQRQKTLETVLWPVLATAR
jgi:hypothetical protein